MGHISDELAAQRKKTDEDAKKVALLLEENKTTYADLDCVFSKAKDYLLGSACKFSAPIGSEE